MKSTLDKTCAACGTLRKSGNLLYDPQTLKPYCNNPYICNEAHPNSPVNLIKNQEEKPLVSFEEAASTHKSRLLKNFDASQIERIQAMISKPQTFRIQDPDQAKFVIELQEEKGFESTAEVYRYCIEMMMESRGVYYSDKKQLAKEKAVQDAAQEAVDSFSQPAEPATKKHVPASLASDEEELSF